MANPHLFDLVPSNSPQPQREQQSSARRICAHSTRFGVQCTAEAAPDSIVCPAHSGGKTSLAALRKQAANLGLLFLERLEEIVITGEPVEVVAAFKTWSDFVGIKDIPPANATGLDDETLEAARHSLEAKLDQLAARVLNQRERKAG